MGIIDIKSHLIKFIKSTRHKQNNPLIWKILFVLEQLIVGGNNRKIVTTAIIKRVSKIISHYRPCQFRPKGFIYSVEEWFNGSIPPQMKGSWIKEIIPEHSVSFKKPNHINDEIHPAFGKNNKIHILPKSCICFLKNAKIVNENGAIISSDNNLFSDFTFEIGKSIEKNEVFKTYIGEPRFRTEYLATITSPDCTGYYHWIFDGLSRLKLLQKVIGDIDYLIVPFNLKKHHLDSLSLLGFPEEKLLRIKNGMHLQCENLFVPYLNRGLPEWKCEFLRESFIPADIEEPHRLIYISRNDALYRKIINENEVEDYLRNIGFEIVQMSKLPFLEQVKICAEARIVVAPHGAGLSNTVFCKNAKILETFSPSYVNVSFWILANHVGNEYYYLLGKDEPGNSPPPWKNYTINMELFKKTIECMMEDF